MLHHGLIASAKRFPEREALVVGEQRLTYAQLDELANQLARALLERGIERGDRVGIWYEKSAISVAAMHAVMRLGAAYVPIDPLMPVRRADIIINNCQLSLVITSEARSAQLADVLQSKTGQSNTVPILLAEETQLREIASLSAVPLNLASSGSDADADQNSLAYILNTSGSTGTPKGVCISHRNALAFVDWSVTAAQLTEQDRLSNHAPFHFDLSVFDLYGAFAVGACVVLIPDSQSLMPGWLLDTMVTEKISVWYSVPSVLTLMVEQAGWLQRPDLQALPLRLIFFAGEPFPTHKLRPLREALAHVRFMNLYGPTETNVCTAYEVTEIPPEQQKPVPIGGGVSGDKVWAQKDDGQEAAIAEEGELMVQGPTVMLGYWGKEPIQDGIYATGDMVRRVAEDCYEYIGRRDAMLKVRGYRIEAGEIESLLRGFSGICDCVVTTVGTGIETKLVACLLVDDGVKAPGILKVKKHLSDSLPRYMIVDRLCLLDEMPHNRNGKTDRRQIKQIVEDKFNKSENK